MMVSLVMGMPRDAQWLTTHGSVRRGSPEGFATGPFSTLSPLNSKLSSGQR